MRRMNYVESELWQHSAESLTSRLTLKSP
ncbi:MAG: hypothetical protein ACI9WR_001035, partial [Paracoccaceae bacterium]